MQHEPLSERERAILTLIAEGQSNNEIAQTLRLSQNTIKWYLQQIYAKLGVKRRTQAVVAARSLGSMQAPEAVHQPVGTHLPSPLTPFLGREAELSELDKLMNDPAIRLVTIVGPGGIGKTQLALTFARQRQSIQERSVFFISLEALTSEEQVVSAI